MMQLSAFGKWVFGLMAFGLAIYVPFIIGGQVYSALWGALKKGFNGFSMAGAGMGQAFKRASESGKFKTPGGQLTTMGKVTGWLGNQMLKNPASAFQTYWAGVEKDRAEATYSGGLTKYIAGKQGQIERAKTAEGAIQGKDAAYIQELYGKNIQKYLEERRQGKNLMQGNMSTDAIEGQSAYRELMNRTQNGDVAAMDVLKDNLNIYSGSLPTHILNDTRFANDRNLLERVGRIVHPTGEEEPWLRPGTPLPSPGGPVPSPGGPTPPPGAAPPTAGPPTPTPSPVPPAVAPPAPGTPAPPTQPIPLKLSPEVASSIGDLIGTHLIAHLRPYGNLSPAERGTHDQALTQGIQYLQAGNTQAARDQAEIVFKDLPRETIRGWDSIQLAQHIHDRNEARKNVSELPGVNEQVIAQRYKNNLENKALVQQGASHINLAAAGQPIAEIGKMMEGPHPANAAVRNNVHQAIDAVVQNLEKDPIIQQRIATTGPMSKNANAIDKLRADIVANYGSQLQTLTESARKNAGQVDTSDSRVQTASENLATGISNAAKSFFGLPTT